VTYFGRPAEVGSPGKHPTINNHAKINLLSKFCNNCFNQFSGKSLE